MAFGAVPTPNIPGATGARIKSARVVIATALLGRIGAPDITADDTGQLTTGTPIANQHQLPPTFGRGAGSWVAGDEDDVIVNLEPTDNLTITGIAGSITYMSAKTVVAGNLVVTIHNRGADVTGTIAINFTLRD